MPPEPPELLDQIPPDQEIASVTADGDFETRKCHDAIAARGTAAIIPPRENAKGLQSRVQRGEDGFSGGGHGVYLNRWGMEARSASIGPLTSYKLIN
jgi:hypothetical protein